MHCEWYGIALLKWSCFLGNPVQKFALSKYDDSDQQWWGGFRQKVREVAMRWNNSNPSMLFFQLSQVWAVIRSADGQCCAVNSRLKHFPVLMTLLSDWPHFSSEIDNCSVILSSVNGKYEKKPTSSVDAIAISKIWNYHGPFDPLTHSLTGVPQILSSKSVTNPKVKSKRNPTVFFSLGHEQHVVLSCYKGE